MLPVKGYTAEHYCRARLRDKRYTATAAAAAAPPATKVPSEMPMTALDCQILALSFFFSTHKWGSIWRPFLQQGLACGGGDGDDVGANRDCCLAIAYGHMGLREKRPTVHEMAQRLYVGVLQRTRAVLDTRSRRDIAKLTITNMLMKIYNVGTNPPPGVSASQRQACANAFLVAASASSRWIARSTIAGSSR